MRQISAIKFVICIIVILLSCNTAKAQTDSISHHTLQGVEITGKKRQSVMRESTPFQLLGKDAIERLGVANLSEAIKTFSGATVQDYGGVGGLKTVSVRSLGSKHTAVGYDGVTITNAQSGQVDIGRFSLENVDAVSLSIGQPDDIFQTARISASAGAVNIRTKTPTFEDKSTNVDAKILAGSFGMFNPSARIEQKLSSVYSFTLDGDWMRADGRYNYMYENGSQIVSDKRSNSDVSSGRVELNMFSDWNKGGKLQLKGYWFDSDRGLPGSVILYNDYHKERLKDKNGFVQAKYLNQITSKLSIQAIGKFDYSWCKYQDYHSRYDDGVMTDLYIQREYYLSAVGYYKATERLSFSLAEDFFVNTLDATIPNCPYPTRYTSLTNLAAQYSTSRLSATASLLATYAKETVKEGESADDKKKLSPAVSFSYKLFADSPLRIRASYKDSYRMPTFNDLYYDRYGDVNLKPEKARQYNLGMTWSAASEALRLDYFGLTVDGYFNHVKDKIVAIPTMFIWKMMNMGTVNIGGLDINTTWRFGLSESVGLLVDGNYTYQHAVDKTTKGSKIYNDQIPYTPRHSGNISVSVENSWVNLSWAINVVGERYALPENINANLIKGYSDQQLTVSKSIKLKNVGLRLQAEVLNLFDKRYDVIRYYPMPGRSFRASIRVTY